jgi:sugar/nucleoside kinase (ribokinase family)
MADIFCLGILVADVIARPVDEYPAPGHLNLCEEIRPSIGGCAANTGIGLQRLGVATAVIGKVGHDGFGQMVADVLAEEGVDVAGLRYDDQAPTSATMVTVRSDAERAFIHCVGANATMRPEDVDWKQVQNARILHIAGHFLMPGFDGGACVEVLREARRLGLRTCLDTAGHPTDLWFETLAPTLPFLDYMVPSYSEARHCVPPDLSDSPHKVAQYFLDQGVGVVALKLGEAGSYLRTAQEEIKVPAFSVEAVDATGAGDAFAAGFLAGALRGLSWRECAQLGNAVGACCVTRLGTVAGIKSYEETMQFIEVQTRSLAV